MQRIEQILTIKTQEALSSLFNATVETKNISIQKTRKEFDGDFTLVVFPFLRFTKKNPEQTAEILGKWFVENIEDVVGFNVIKGFLNLQLNVDYWRNFLRSAISDENYGRVPECDETVVIEYSSPNTNKPLHLGHIRNNLLGWSVAELLKAVGKKVIKVNLVNDRGIHICKSMLAWLRYGEGETPESSGLKGDHLIGKYYVLFDKKYKAEVAVLVEKGVNKKEAEKEAPLLKEAQIMLKKWETGDKEVRDLWEKLNSWTYQGFEKTYTRLGIDFDKTYYESNTYLLGKSLVNKGLESGVLRRHEDGSVWADLTKDGLDEKLLLRADGTSVYMTQDLGTAVERYEEFNAEKMIYVVGNEQNYHFDVLKLILKKLGYSWSENLYHLSYGMVELPDGKMKSREGTVVDADDLMETMYKTARTTTEALGKIDDFDSKEALNLYNMVSLGALKYFMLKVDPKKKMLFVPDDSIDFNGNTGPFIQYTHARICSLIKKSGIDEGVNIIDPETCIYSPKEKEVDLLRFLYEYPEVVKSAGASYSPAIIANYAYDLAKVFNKFYQEVPILREEDKMASFFRLNLSRFTATVLRSSLALLGIDMPDRM